MLATTELVCDEGLFEAKQKTKLTHIMRKRKQKWKRKKKLKTRKLNQKTQ